MEELTLLEKIIDRIATFFERYDCKKNRHRWGYTLSDSGVVYLDDSKVPKEHWKCLDCGIKKFN